MLFETAMGEDIVELREKFNQLTSFASAQNKLIHLNFQNIKILEHQVQDKASYTNILRSSLDDMLIDPKHLYSINVLEQILAALENAVNLLPHTHDRSKHSGGS